MVVLASTTVLALALVGAEHAGFDTLRVARLAVLRRVPVSGIRAVGQRARNDDNGNQGRHQKQTSHTTPPRKVPQWPEYDRVPDGAQAPASAAGPRSGGSVVLRGGCAGWGQWVGVGFPMVWWRLGAIVGALGRSDREEE